MSTYNSLNETSNDFGNIMSGGAGCGSGEKKK